MEAFLLVKVQLHLIRPAGMVECHVPGKVVVDVDPGYLIFFHVPNIVLNRVFNRVINSPFIYSI